jgi:hypothetical protein
MDVKPLLSVLVLKNSIDVTRFLNVGTDLGNHLNYVV